MPEAERRCAAVRSRWAAALLTLAMGLPGPALGSENGSFEAVDVRFEQNATDGDVEVVFEVNGGDGGLAKLTVLAPDGRSVAGVEAPPSRMGIRQFVFESPEPKDAEALKAAYPAGAYRFAATTAAGEELRGEATLSHELPATVYFLLPAAGARGVPAAGLAIAWSPGGTAAAYIVELAQEDLGVSLKATLPGTATRFSVPDGFLRPGTEYDLGIGSVSEEGNVSFVETTFSTAE